MRKKNALNFLSLKVIEYVNDIKNASQAVTTMRTCIKIHIPPEAKPLFAN